jgi:hypothetical protein
LGAGGVGGISVAVRMAARGVRGVSVVVLMMAIWSLTLIDSSEMVEKLKKEMDSGRVLFLLGRRKL